LQCAAYVEYGSGVQTPSFVARCLQLAYLGGIYPAMPNPEELDQIAAEQVERRRESRVNQPASVTVWTEQPGRGEKFQAVLVNSSTGGLAIRHWRKELLIGQQVRVSCGQRGEMLAAVIWNWAVGPVVISGLNRLEHADFPPIRVRSVVECLEQGSGTNVRAKVRSWMWAALMGVLILAGWYVRNRIL